MDLQSLNYFDVILGGAVIISALIGIARGLVREVLSLIAWFVAIWAAFSFADHVATKFVKQFISDEHIAYIAAFGLVFLVALFAIGLLNLLLSSIFKATGLGGFDRLLGMLFGLVRGIIIGAIIVFFSRLYPGIDGFDSWHTSKLVPGFSNIANWGIKRIPENVRAYADSWLNPDDVSILMPKNSVESTGEQMISLSSLQSTEQSAATHNNNASEPLNKPTSHDKGIILESLDNTLGTSNNVNMPDAPVLELESIQ